MQYADLQNCKKSPFKGDIRRYLTVHGYTKSSGCPTDYMIQLQGSLRWYRVWNYCTSNSGTLFVKTKDNDFLVVREFDLKLPPKHLRNQEE